MENLSNSSTFFHQRLLSRQTSFLFPGVFEVLMKRIEGDEHDFSSDSEERSDYEEEDQELSDVEQANVEEGDVDRTDGNDGDEESDQDDNDDEETSDAEDDIINAWKFPW